MDRTTKEALRIAFKHNPVLAASRFLDNQVEAPNAAEVEARTAQAREGRRSAEMIAAAAEKMQEAARGMRPQEPLPTYVLAVLGADAAKLTSLADRPYQWLWETRYFGTMLYSYLRGRKGKKRLMMNHVCARWLDKSGEPMNYNSIKAMNANGEIPDRLEDSLAHALEAVGYPYNPPTTRDTKLQSGKLLKVKFK